jgi:hypothetical protein
MKSTADQRLKFRPARFPHGRFWTARRTADGFPPTTAVLATRPSAQRHRDLLTCRPGHAEGLYRRTLCET